MIDEKELNKNEEAPKVKDDNSSKIQEIEEDINNIEDKFGIDSDMETIKEKVSDDDNRLYEIEIELQTLDVKLDELDNLMQISEDNYFEHVDEYKEVKAKQKELLKEKKVILKGTKQIEKRDLDNLSIWIIFYGLAMIIINLPVVSYNLWIKFASWLIDIFQNVFSKITSDDFLYYPIIGLLIYALPIILIILSWELYINFVKNKENKTDKLVFIILWIAQAALTLFMMIYLGIEVFSGL